MPACMCPLVAASLTHQIQMGAGPSVELGEDISPAIMFSVKQFLKAKSGGFLGAITSLDLAGLP